MYQFDFMPRRSDTLLGFLLKRMDDPDILCQLQCINDPICIASRFNRQLPYAASKTRERLCYIGRCTFGDIGERRGSAILSFFRGVSPGSHERSFAQLMPAHQVASGTGT
jgi:hypothetical protein